MLRQFIQYNDAGFLFEFNPEQLERQIKVENLSSSELAFISEKITKYKERIDSFNYAINKIIK